MNKISFLCILAAMGLASCSDVKEAQPDAGTTMADMVVYGKIYTADNAESMAEAFAVKGGKYIFVGSKADAQKYITTDTKVIDHTGKGMIMPGMTDGHSHYLMQQVLPMFAENSIKFTNEDSYQDVLNKVKAKVEEAKAAHKTLSFIYGEGYNYMFFSQPRDYRDLDAISDDTPMFLASFDQHSCWCNSAAMINAGIIDKAGNMLRDEIKGGVVGKD